MRTGRSYSPRPLVSNSIRLPPMPGRVSLLLIVMMRELADDRFGLQIVIPVVIVAVVAHGAVEAFTDTV
jgi:hypothetical protein